MSNRVLTPNGILSELLYQEHTDEVAHRRTQPNEDLILARNYELRKQPEAFKKNDYLQPVASIPIIMWEKAIREGFALNARDHATADSELARYLSSPEGKLCMLTEKTMM